jgi:hypothetical protein
MGIVNVITQIAGEEQPRQVMQTISCDRPGCGNTVTFDTRLGKEAVAANPWLNTIRIVRTPDKREYLLCSDVCEIENIKSGAHNKQEPKQIITDGSAQAVAAAAQAAEAAKASDANLRSGSGGPVLVQG